MLNEQFYNKQLHPRFWSEDGEMDDSVRDKLVQITEDFCSDLGINEHIQDIQLTGSLANYNYTKYSDLDVHILLDFKDINKDEELVKQSLDGQRFIWNNHHNIIIREHEVELYFQDIDEPHISSGLYSLLDHQWIVIPKYDPPQVDKKDVDKKASQWLSDVQKLLNNLDEATTPKQFEELHAAGNRLRKKLSRMRKDSLDVDGEFGIGNLAFKWLRDNKVIEQLISFTNTAYDKIYSEEGFSAYAANIY